MLHQFKIRKVKQHPLVNTKYLPVKPMRAVRQLVIRYYQQENWTIVTG